MLMIKYNARKKTLRYNSRLQRPVLLEMPCTTACYLRLLHFYHKSYLFNKSQYKKTGISWLFLPPVKIGSNYD